MADDLSPPLDPDVMPKWLAAHFKTPRGSGVLAGVDDDDCAIVELGGELLVATTDFLNARPIATELGVGSAYDLGRLVVAANLADLCGTGADPLALLVAVTLERGSTRQRFEDLMLGVRDEATLHGVPVVGGDTKLGAADAILCTALGRAREESELFLKGGGHPNDLLWCSGPLGSTSAAALGLAEGYGTDEWRAWAARAITVPRVPLRQSRTVAASGLGHAGVDISDGLGADLLGLCSASGLGVEIDVDQIPVEPEVRELATAMSIQPWAFSFSIGGDFQFIVSTPDSESARAVAADAELHLIGRLTIDSQMTLKMEGQTIPMPTAGHRDARRLSFAEEILSLLPQHPASDG